MAGRSTYRSTGFPSARANLSRAWDRSGDRSGDRGGDRDRWDARRRSFENWYANFPAWPGYAYPYLIDSGFYDWGDSDDAADDGSGSIPETLSPNPGGGYDAADEASQQGYPGELPPWNAQAQQPAAADVSASLAPEQTITLIFKSGRAPVKMQNYMMTAKAITDLDSRPYEQIPIDEIDIAATQRVNSAAGVGFEIPGASRD